MKVLKVIVDELPKDCRNCQFYDCANCYATMLSIFSDDEFVIAPMSECPLMREGEVFNWIMNRDVTDYEANGMKESEDA